MNRWENLHCIVYWDGTGRQAVAVYMNGCKMEALCGADRQKVLEHLHELKLQGWEKFGHERPDAGLLETYYYQRLMQEVGLRPEQRGSLPLPQFVHHRAE